MHEMPVTEVPMGDRPASTEVPMSATSRTAQAAPGTGSLALVAAIAAGAILFVAVAFAALTSTPGATIAPIAAPAPITHDHGWSSTTKVPAVGPAHPHGRPAAPPAPVVLHDHGWADGSAGIMPWTQDEAPIQVRFGR